MAVADLVSRDAIFQLRPVWLEEKLEIRDEDVPELRVVHYFFQGVLAL